MRWLLILLAVFGIVVSSLALREHYRTDPSPCSINEKWDCGIVNHSPYATLHGIPVAVIGIAGYLLLGALAFGRNTLGCSRSSQSQRSLPSIWRISKPSSSESGASTAPRHWV